MDAKKQVVFIMTDTTRFDMVGCYGFPVMKTPFLDDLASKGVRFEKTYSCQPVCGPARSAIFTGLFPHSNGSISNCMPLGAGIKTAGEYLQQAGVHSAYIGKWHLDGGDYFGNGICPAGYDSDYWYDMRCYLEELSPELREYSRKEASSLEGIDESFTFAHRCTERALSFLNKHGSRTSLIYVPNPMLPCTKITKCQKAKTFTIRLKKNRFIKSCGRVKPYTKTNKTCI